MASYDQNEKGEWWICYDQTGEPFKGPYKTLAKARAAFEKLKSIDKLIVQGKPQATLMETSAAWPRKSVSLEVDAKQKKSAEEHAAKLGVPTEYEVNSTGGAQPIIRNNEHQRKLYKALGYINRDGGYGQITG